jgi:anti-anti-sigma factor
MNILIEKIENDVTLISLEGSMDTAGVQAIDNRFAFATSTAAKKIVVDLSEVTFLASIGIGTILGGAQSQKRRGGKLVLLNPKKQIVQEVLVRTRINEIIEIYNDLESARRAFESL